MSQEDLNRFLDSATSAPFGKVAVTPKTTEQDAKQFAILINEAGFSKYQELRVGNSQEFTLSAEAVNYDEAWVVVAESKKSCLL